MTTDPKPQENARTEHAFQAEVRQVLDIVIRSLYTDREIFLRELVSNAIDALEKRRLSRLVDGSGGEEKPGMVTVEADKVAHRVVISDDGIGMTRDELVENLGTVAQSGTRRYLEAMKAQAGAPADGGALIGRFGVGFYASFMVAERVTVTSTAAATPDVTWTWTSDGAGTFAVEPAAASRPVGTTVELALREDAREFEEADRVRALVREHSNFASFEIRVNGEHANAVSALWMKPKDAVDDKTYEEFYRFLSGAFDTPRYRMHFAADAPLAIRALLFVAGENTERFGFGRMEPGVNLYCKRVLLRKRPDDFLPAWLRFARGAVDCEDLPLNISRETMQDSALARKLGRVITRRMLKFLAERRDEDRDKYGEFFAAFGNLLKEGAIEDNEYREEIVPLLLYPSSTVEAGKMTTLDEYVGRMKEGQKEIYFAHGDTRDAIEAGPYADAFRKRGFEVLYVFETFDDFLFTNLGEWKGKKIQAADAGDLDLGDGPAAGLEGLVPWLKGLLDERVESVKVSNRLVAFPAAIVTAGGRFTTAMQRAWRDVNKSPAMTRVTLELNPDHAIVKALDALRGDPAKADLAKLAALHLLDGALLAAGLLDTPVDAAKRQAQVLERLLGA